MEKCLGKIFLLIALLVTNGLLYAQPEKKKCCESPVCKEKAVEYAKVISGLVAYLGNCSISTEEDLRADSIILAKLQEEKPEVYNDLIRMVKLLDDYLYTDIPRFRGTDCFENELPQSMRRNVLCWINYIRFNVLKKVVVFPSTEFCGGWKKRFEINQGASAFLSKTDMSYLGSARFYFIYTFFKKNKCGGKFRMSAGPAYFLRSRNSYLTLSSRLAYNIKDLKANVFSLGNLNLFGGYNTNFNRFNYAELGLEVELGPFGVNLASNMNTENGKMGFMVGVFFGNKKRTKPKT